MTFILGDDAGRQVYIQTEFRVGYRIRRAVDDQISGLLRAAPYGLPAFGDRFTSTPEISVGISNAGREYSLGWRLVRGGDKPDGSALELAVEAQRRESASRRNALPAHALSVRMISRF